MKKTNNTYLWRIYSGRCFLYTFVILLFNKNISHSEPFSVILRFFFCHSEPKAKNLLRWWDASSPSGKQRSAWQKTWESYPCVILSLDLQSLAHEESQPYVTLIAHEESQPYVTLTTARFDGEEGSLRGWDSSSAVREATLRVTKKMSFWGTDRCRENLKNIYFF